MKKPGTSMTARTAALAVALAALVAAHALAPHALAPQAFAQGREENDPPRKPLDLTTLAPEAPAEGKGLTPEEEDASSSGGERIVVSTGLRARNPATVRLASLGLDRPPVDGLDRLMWGSTDADRAIAIYARLPEMVASPVLRQRLEHIMLSRSVPPGGTVDHTEALIGFRLGWLRNHANADDLATLVRQLPNEEPWLEWKRWLAVHDLINRNDEEGCGYASERIAATLENVWHQINAFCQAIAGDVGQASFGLDILADSGVEDPAYFALMEHLTGGSGNTAVPEDAAIGPLNLVLMDSARVEISSAALQSAPDHRSSLGGLRYLGDDAQILLAARLFDRHDLAVGDIIPDWAALPEANIPASEALTALSVAGAGDEVALARLLAWQAVALEGDRGTASDLALRALSLDYRHAGGRSLELWAPFIQDSDAAYLRALLPGDDAADQLPAAQLPESAAWSAILAESSNPVEATDLVEAGAADAVPLLRALGRKVGEIEWNDQIAVQRALAPGGASLRFGHLLALEESVAAGNKAEALLMAAAALGPLKPWDLGRDDAARLVAALMRVGLKQTARDLAREILAGWVLERHFTVPEEDNAATG